MTQEALDHLIYGSFIKDKRVTAAKNLLKEALNDHQEKITGIKPPEEILKIPYEKIVHSFSSKRGTPLFFPYIGSGIGKGPFVELMDGSIKYDFISGIGVHFFGHNPLGILDSNIDSALANTVMQGPLQQNFDSLELINLLTKVSGLDCCFLTSSGAMANENGLKIAFQKCFPRNRLLAFERGFAGRTLALSQVTDKPLFRKGLPKTIDVDYIPFYDPTYPEKSIENAVHSLKAHIKRYPNQHAAMIFELIQGEGGFYPGTPVFFKTLIEILKKHEILVFIDEVQTFGRTEKLFAYQYFDLEASIDIVTIGKLSQACATLFRKELMPEKGLISQTFSSSTASIKASLWMINSLIEGGFFGHNGKIAVLEKHFHEKLSSMEKKMPERIRGPFGIGGMVAFTVYGGDREKSMQFAEKLFEEGVISFIAGDQPTRIRFLLPVGVITKSDIDCVQEIIEKILF